jgi:3,4-dihydroxy 2-butanone 4-phosphate synthase/GTP cyclohydrolase II
VSKRRTLLGSAMQMIGDAGSGVVVVINRQQGAFFSSLVKAREQIAAGSTHEASVMDLRDYGLGAQILADLGVHEMVLLTNNQLSFVALSGYGLAITEQRPIPV